MTWVKICGLRSDAGIDAAVAAGADAVGFNFWPKSARFVEPAVARAWVARLPERITPVGVFVGATPTEVAAAVASSGVRMAQLHGDEDPERYREVGATIIQVLRLEPGVGAAALDPAAPAARWVLLDRRVSTFGGSGEPLDWPSLRGAEDRVGRPVILAGGLRPDNVQRAIDEARPFGVDVASGIESSRGVADPARITAFVDAARRAKRHDAGEREGP